MPCSGTVVLYTLLFSTLVVLPEVAADPISIAVPPSPPSTHAVQPNFLGISLELGFMGEYFGNDTSSIPPTIINYLAALRSRVGSKPLRIRIGGNSMDSSIYVPSQTSPMVQLMANTSDANDQPVNYSPILWDVMDKVSSDIGGANYLLGLSLRDPNNTNVPLLAGDAAQKLGDNLDGFLLGNEPDLYTAHGQRPDIANYTTSIYMDDFRTVAGHLTTTSAGNILDEHNIGGPTICCSWNLDALIDDGYITSFANILKYVSLQHYPQNNCFGSYKYEIPYYVQHANVVELASWQSSGIGKVLSNTGPNRQELIMSEFNSASCGGIPSISDTFAVGSLWTIDYALQMASVGYSAAYLHTRERGISYNLFSPPEGPNGSPGPWTTNPPFYGLLVTAEALRSTNGSIVADLDIGGSKKNTNATVSGYAIYDAVDSTVRQLVLFNYANGTASEHSSTSFAIPATAFPSTTRKNVTVKYLVGDSLKENKNIGWGGKTFANVIDGEMVETEAIWAPANIQIDCTSGCAVNVPAPGMAILFAGGESLHNGGTVAAPTNTGVVKNDAPNRKGHPVQVTFITLALYLYTHLSFI